MSAPQFPKNRIHVEGSRDAGPSGSLIDIHSHVLPRIDDGARNLDEAVQMLGMAVADGIRIVVATPHASRVNREGMDTRLTDLRHATREAGLDVAILPGSEVRLSADLGDRYREGDLITLNDTSYVLVELPFHREWSPMIRSSLYSLQLAGALPIIAHAERYPAVQRQPSVLLELVEMGAVIQVNADSLLGEDGRASRRTAEGLVRAGMAHVIATDAHRIDSRRPLLRASLDRVAALSDRSEAAKTQVNAAAVLQGRPITAPDPRAEALQSGSRFSFSLMRL